MFQSKIIYLLIRTDVKGSDNDLFASHVLCDCPVRLKLLFLARIILCFQIQKLTAEKSDTAGIISKYTCHIANTTDICIKGDLPAGFRDILFAL